MTRPRSDSTHPSISAARSFRLPKPLLVLLLHVVGAILPGRELGAQVVPEQASLRELISVFIAQTASPLESVDRLAFGPRLAGALAGTSPVRFKGTIPEEAKAEIDTLVELGEEGRIVRTAAYVTVRAVGECENLYFFLERDSIWRIDGLYRFPTPTQRKQLVESLAEVDTTSQYGRSLYGDIRRLLLPDDSLVARLADDLGYAAKIVRPLMKGKLWRRFFLREVHLSGIDEYRELDDDIPPEQLLYYKLDRPAVERLKHHTGIVWIERDERYPNALFMVGGSIGENSYGYIYADSPESIPAVSVDEFVMVRPVAEHWWLYKRVGG